MNHDLISKALNWRYAVRKFDSSRKISDADWKILAHSLLMAPSSYGLQPWKFLVVQDSSLREQLKPASWGQSQVTDSSHFVVFATKEHISSEDIGKYMARISEVRGVPVESLKGFSDSLHKNVVTGMAGEKLLSWTQRQAYIAMGFLLETAALLSIDSTPMEGLDPVQYDKILALHGTGWRTVAAVALGYRHKDDPIQSWKKVRFLEEDVIEFR